MAKKKIEKKIRIKLVRSIIGKKPDHRATVKALGLKKLNSQVEKDVNPAIMGMVTSISHLIVWEEVK